MKKICFVFILVGIVSVTVFGQKKRELSIPVDVTYMLPKMSFDVEVIMECDDLIPGPFRQYAEQQLGVKPDIEAARQEWRIKNIRLIPRPLPDAEHVYTVTTSGEYHAICLTLTPEGFLAGVGNSKLDTPVQEEIVYIEPQENTNNSIQYVRFGIRSTQKEVLDSNFTMIEVEGEMRRVWDPIERYVLKAEADYVQEITNEIFNIRKKRVEMLAGENSSGQATVAALNELRELEENYMSLFMGKRVKRQVSKVYSYMPEKANESTVLFRFSKSEGITAKNNVAAEPYIVEIKNVLIPGTPAVPAAKDSRPAAGITYRVPAVADVNLMVGNRRLTTQRCVIPQLGYLKVFPLDVINNEGISIDFYPQYGSVKSINRNR